MNNIILDKAKELFNKQVDSSLTQSEIEEFLYSLSKEICELQKQECEKSAQVEESSFYDSNLIEENKVITRHVYWNDKNNKRQVIVNNESILNCKNICDE
jgi:ribosomal protein S3AE